MKKSLVFMALAFEISLVHAEKATQVYFDNGELNYVGEISQEANKEVFDLFASLDNKPTRLSIRSPGGPTDPGIALGTWVHKHGLTVKVLEFCFSSCANYVFTAAPKKIVSNFAVIGFHGGLSSKSFKLDAEQEAIFAAMPKEEQMAARKQLDDEIKKMVASKEQEERDFFR
ncbi:hypothetical protein [Massilia sp. DD77]|uniref:hypothetical protein n=1 Tax=Massilia sp. DD77 TaxID=3109349 RepID=UPI002FFDDA8D